MEMFTHMNIYRFQYEIKQKRLSSFRGIEITPTSRLLLIVSGAFNDADSTAEFT
jgi:hypothetical protein